MPPRTADNDAERLERLQARLAQLQIDGRRAIAKARDIRERANALISTTRRKLKDSAAVSVASTTRRRRS
jgi:hypothetical protein